ncbi:CRISPR-associated protein Cas6 [Candidatus Desulfofervidus auxilii]|uniref:CRISPR-associated endoribonuclease n=1 Tax=Desulfofervidus auxilii TaxID=1621989 RepID=A0A7U4THT7_DESA2|nr:CRISPR-associated endoribonuclease Cas6 [Candidatus Desulfofervidus auxilii]AMM41229.1 CRISPR-associated protein Cas6 [Candidatus Desulfofervidus auxilii]
MRIEINLSAETPLILPKSHNHLLQGFIYSLLDPLLRKRLHKEGYPYEKRRFKLFTFSRLLGKVKMFKEYFQFNPPLKLIISSPKDEILQSLAEGLLKSPEVILSKNTVYIDSINVAARSSFNHKVTIKMLSPITIRSTLYGADGSKKSYYYSPFEKEFCRLIKENLRKKYKIVFNKNLGHDFEFSIKPQKVPPSCEKIIIYKGTVIKAWMGIYEIKGNPEVIALSYDTGLGAKNSQGFGCWEKL